MLAVMRVAGGGTVVAMVLSALALRGSVAQLPTSSPPPNISRPPLITLLPPDSIRLQVTQLQLYQLLANLQRADATARDADLAEVQWGSADQASRSTPQCASLGAAISAAATRLASGSSTPGTPRALPIFLPKPSVADSGGAAVVSGDLTIVPPSGTRVSGPVLLTLNRDRMRWSKAHGLLALVCGVATQGSP